MHDQSFGIEGFRRSRPLLVEIQLAIHVVLDERRVVASQ